MVHHDFVGCASLAGDEEAGFLRDWDSLLNSTSNPNFQILTIIFCVELFCAIIMVSLVIANAFRISFILITPSPIPEPKL
jgi:hypothetical protein